MVRTCERAAKLVSIATSARSLDRPGDAKLFMGRAHGPTRLWYTHARPRDALDWFIHTFSPSRSSLVLTRLNIVSDSLVTRHTRAPTRTHCNQSGGRGILLGWRGLPVHSLSSVPNPASHPPVSSPRSQSFLCLSDQSQPSLIALERARLHDQSPVASAASTFDVHQSSRLLSLRTRIWIAFIHAKLLRSLPPTFNPRAPFHSPLGSHLVNAATSATRTPTYAHSSADGRSPPPTSWPFWVSPKVGAASGTPSERCARSGSPLCLPPVGCHYVDPTILLLKYLLMLHSSCCGLLGYSHQWAPD
jgi:hypothetical protein